MQSSLHLALRLHLRVICRARLLGADLRHQTAAVIANSTTWYADCRRREARDRAVWLYSDSTISLVPAAASLCCRILLGSSMQISSLRMIEFGQHFGKCDRMCSSAPSCTLQQSLRISGDLQHQPSGVPCCRDVRNGTFCGGMMAESSRCKWCT